MIQSFFLPINQMMHISNSSVTCIPTPIHVPTVLENFPIILIINQNSPTCYCYFTHPYAFPPPSPYTYRASSVHLLRLGSPSVLCQQDLAYHTQDTVHAPSCFFPSRASLRRNLLHQEVDCSSPY